MQTQQQQQLSSGGGSEKRDPSTHTKVCACVCESQAKQDWGSVWLPDLPVPVKKSNLWTAGIEQ